MPTHSGEQESLVHSISQNSALAGTAAPRMRVEDLSFVANRDGKSLPKPKNGQLPRCFWNVNSTGDYSIDVDLGGRLAVEYLDYEESNADGHGILNSIVDDMPRPLTGVEHGFLIMVCFQAKEARGRARQILDYWDRAAGWRRPSGKGRRAESLRA